MMILCLPPPTRLEKFQHVLDKTRHQLVGGRILDNGRDLLIFHGLMYIKDKQLYLDTYKKGPKLDGYPRYDFVLNFFLARTEMLRSVRWDSELKICEHEEFFWRLKKAGIPLTELSTVSIAHYPTESGPALAQQLPEYQKKRFDRLQYFHALSCNKVSVR